MGSVAPTSALWLPCGQCGSVVGDELSQKRGLRSSGEEGELDSGPAGFLVQVQEKNSSIPARANQRHRRGSA